MLPREPIAVISCGAIARELNAIARVNGWDHLEIEALDPELHNRPERIPGAVRDRLEKATARGRRCFVAYADCGTGGQLDAVVAEYDAERLPGAHCYELFAGAMPFARLSEQEPGTFYLTDFLVRNFERLVHRGLGLDRYPELHATYFGNYRRVVYLAQSDDEDLERRARRYAAQLGLEYRYRRTGLAPLSGVLGRSLPRQIQWHS
jgi:hypothetical protein